MPTTGFVAAAFRHRSSRAGDPLLHTHVLVANLGQAIDDRRWRTIDARALYVHAKTAGYLYQAQLRAELTRRLGVEWGPVRNGCADLAGVPDEVIRAFSRRRAEIEAHLAARGESSAKAAQVATLATRRAKQHQVEPAALGADWATRAAALGFGPDQVGALVHQPAEVTINDEGASRIASHLVAPGGLTAHASTFTRRDVVRGCCAQLPCGADIGDIVSLAGRLLAAGDGVLALTHSQLTARGVSGDAVIRSGDGRLVPADPDEARYSTAELLAIEQRLVDTAVHRRRAGVAIAAAGAVEVALARRPTLAGEQARMVQALTTSGAGVEVVVGKAGAGKTFALDAARDAWQQSGIRVIGCALAARAAAELEAGAAIPSSTLDALLTDLDRPAPHGGLAANSVVVVDEAGMVGTRKLARLLDHAQSAGAKVVLVGDHRQLPEIDAGGVFRGLVHRLDAIELVDNRRQRQRWERDALDQLRDGDPAGAVAAYHEHGRIVVADSADAVREQLVSDWWNARVEHDRPGAVGVMIALRVSDVDDLNDRARSRLAASGDLTGPTITATTGREYRAGDRVVCLRNDRRLGVLNGSSGQVTAVHPRTGALDVRLDDGRNARLPSSYLDAGRLGHGYAITGHKAQGMTAEQVWVLGSDAMYREWGYVALSRSRAGSRLYLVAGHDHGSDELHSHVPHLIGDATSELTHHLTRSKAQQLAVEHLPEQHPRQRQPRRRTPVQNAVERLRRELADALDAIDDVDQQRAAIHSPQKPPGVLSRLRHRGQRQALQAEAARLDGDLAAWNERVADLRRRLSALDVAPTRETAAEVPPRGAADCDGARTGPGATVLPLHPSGRQDCPVDNSESEMRRPQDRTDDRGIGIA